MRATVGIIGVGSPDTQRATAEVLLYGFTGDGTHHTTGNNGYNEDGGTRQRRRWHRAQGISERDGAGGLCVCVRRCPIGQAVPTALGWLQSIVIGKAAELPGRSDASSTRPPLAAPILQKSRP